MTRTFLLGRILATPGALAACAEAGVSPLHYIDRDPKQDGGGVCEADQRANDEALTSGGRVFSAYMLPNRVRLWVITEATDGEGKRAATTLLLPEEY